MPRQIDNHNSKEYINRLRSEILAKIADEWKEKWAKNHGITDDITISSGHTVTIPSGQTGFLSKGNCKK